MDSSAQPFTGQTEPAQPAAPVTQSAQPQLQVVTPGAAIIKSAYPVVLKPFVATEREGEYEFFLRDLEKSGLAPADVREWYAVRGEGIGRFTRLLSSEGGQATAPGYAIPYLGLDGEPIEDAGQEFIRFRLQSPLQRVKKDDGTWKEAGKYLSPKDTSWHLYVPAATRKLLLGTAHDDRPLVITEGEKKAESLVRLTGIPCVALPGIQMWFDPDADKRDALSVRALHPELVKVLEAYREWTDGRPTVLVVFDSDGLPGEQREGSVEVKVGRKTMHVANADVFRAAGTLARRVYDDRAMTFATAARFCPGGTDGAKQGLDDWIVSAGAKVVKETLYSWAAEPDLKVKNDSGLPVHVMTGNFAVDLGAHKQALQGSDDVYVFGTQLAAIGEDGQTLVRLTHEAHVADYVSRVLQTCTTGEKGQINKSAPSTRLCSALANMDWTAVPGMRRLDAVAHQPVPTIVGGQVRLSTAGYDDVSRTYGAFAEAKWAIPEKPTEAEYIEACLTLGELIREMYLQSPGDVSAAMAAILTAVCRPGLPVAPGFVISAPNPGAGKSYFAQVLAHLAGDDGVHTSPETLTYQARGQGAEAEFSKMVLGVLQGRSKTMLFDEVDGTSIDGPSLRKLITAEAFSARVLGRNEVLTLPTRKLVLFTANNVDPSEDSARRFIIVRINPPVDPSRRNQSATKGALGLVGADRARYVRAALLAATQGYILSEGRMPAGMQMLSGFDDWSVLCAGPAALATWMLISERAEPVNLVEHDEQALAAISEKDPLREAIESISPMARQRQVAAADPARMALRDLLESLWKAQQGRIAALSGADKYIVDGVQTWTAAMLVEELREQRRYADRYQRDFNADVEPAQFAALAELRESGLRDDQLSNVRSLGQALKKLRDKEVDGFQLVDVGHDRTSTVRWHVKRIGKPV